MSVIQPIDTQLHEAGSQTESLNPRSRIQGPLMWLLVMAMMTGPIEAFRQNIFGRWADGFLFVGVVAAWGLFSTLYLARLPGWERQTSSYRSAEIVIIGVIIRIYLWLQNGFPTQAEWGDILRSPGILLSDSWFVYLGLALFVWGWSLGLAALFYQLEVSPAEEEFYSLPVKDRQSKLDTPLRQQRTPLLQEYFRRWVFGGLILIVFAASTTIRVSEMTEVSWFTQLNRLPIPGTVLIGMILYLFVGLWLLSYARYTVLYSRWLAHGARPQPTMARHWRRRSLLLLAIIGLVAGLLPIGSSVPLLWIASALVWLVSTIVTLILGLLALLLASATSGEDETVQEQLTQLQPEPFQPPAPLVDPGATNTIPPELTGGLILAFLVTIIVIAGVFLVYGRNYGTQAAAGNLWQRFLLWWWSLWGSAKLRVLELQEQIQQRTALETPAEVGQGRQRLFRINSLTPREQIRYFYLSAVRRAKERGVERGSHETPAEFLQRLQEEWPDSAESSEQLTDAFLQARYSQQDVDGEADSVKKTWKKVRTALRRRKAKKSD